MKKDQIRYIVWSPLILAAHCLAAVGEVIRDFPKEFVEALEFLGHDDE